MNAVRPQSISASVSPRLALRPMEACQALGIGKTKLFALLKSGQLKSVRLGTARLILMESINALLTPNFVDECAAAAASSSELGKGRSKKLLSTRGHRGLVSKPRNTRSEQLPPAEDT